MLSPLNSITELFLQFKWPADICMHQTSASTPGTFHGVHQRFGNDFFFFLMSKKNLWKNKSIWSHLPFMNVCHSPKTAVPLKWLNRIFYQKLPACKVAADFHKVSTHFITSVQRTKDTVELEYLVSPHRMKNSGFKLCWTNNCACWPLVWMGSSIAHRCQQECVCPITNKCKYAKLSGCDILASLQSFSRHKAMCLTCRFRLFPPIAGWAQTSKKRQNNCTLYLALIACPLRCVCFILY